MMNLGKKIGFATLLAFSATSANALVLDTFDYQLDITTNALIPVASSSETTLLGFDALYTLTYGGPATDFTSTARADTVNIIGASDGELAYASAGVTASVLDITWTDLSAAPGDYLDLVGAGDSAIYFDLESVDLSFNLDMVVTWFDGLGLVNTTYSTILDAASVTTPTTITYDFTNWVGADFTQVAAFSTRISGVPDADFRISEVGTTNVPEPTTVALFGLALVGFGLSAKRKAK